MRRDETDWIKIARNKEKANAVGVGPSWNLFVSHNTFDRQVVILTVSEGNGARKIATMQPPNEDVGQNEEAILEAKEFVCTPDKIWDKQKQTKTQYQ